MMRTLKDMYWGLLRPLAASILPTIRLLWTYRRTMGYMLRKRGLRALYNFLYARLVVREVGHGIFDPIWTTFPSLAPVPSFMEIEVTTKCDLKCLICEHTHWQEKSEDLTFDEFKTIVDQFPPLKWCNPTGEGSALLNRDYPKMLDYLKSNETFVELVESFGRIGEDTGRELIEMGIDRIWVSVDGATKATYEAIKVGLDFDVTLENLRRFVSLKRELRSPTPELCFRYIITTMNLAEVPDFVDIVAGLGAREDLGDGAYIEYAGLLEFPEIKHLVPGEVPDAIIEETERRAAKAGIPVAWCHSHHDPAKKTNVRRCAAWTEPYIMMKGYVIPCCAILMSNRRPFLRKHSFGNCLETPFREIWDSPRYSEFRRRVNSNQSPVPIQCVGCRGFDTTAREKQCGVMSGEHQ